MKIKSSIKYLFVLATFSLLTLHASRSKIPIDSNLELGNEKGILYYVDPKVEDGGENRALRIDTNTMTFQEISVNGMNPHSIDRAGKSNKFYIRTQDENSFDVVNFKKDRVKTISLKDHKPRAIGAYNDKYKIQLLSAKDMPIIDVINTRTDSIIATVGDRHKFNPSDIHGNCGTSATGHAIWLTKKHFILIDRVHSQLKLYKVFKRWGKLRVVLKDIVKCQTPVHSIIRAKKKSHKPWRNNRFSNSRRLHLSFNSRHKFTYYALGEGDVEHKIPPFVLKLKLIPYLDKLRYSKYPLYASTKSIDGVKPTTHHGGITPDGKHLIIPVFDGKIYIINRHNMKTEKIIDTKQLGAAHIEFSNSRNLAIITNHFSDKITILDLNHLRVKKYLTISHHKFDPNNKHLLQPHFSHVSSNGKYFYTFATQDGDFLKIDLDELKIIDTLHTGGRVEQAHS